MGYRATHAPNTPINPPRMNDSRRFCKNVLFGTALTCFDLVDSDTTVDEVEAPGVELVVVDVEPFELVETAGVVPGSSPWGVCPRVVRRFIRRCRFRWGAWWTEWRETRDGDGNEDECVRGCALPSPSNSQTRRRRGTPPVQHQPDDLAQPQLACSSSEPPPVAAMLTLLLPFLLPLVLAQSCANYGTALTPTTCACPPGFGGPQCATLACQNPILRSTSRVAFSTTAAGNNGAGGCGAQCDAGFGGGPICNVCQSDDACRAATGASTLGSTSAATSGDIVCNKAPYTYTQGFLTCAVVVRASSSNEENALIS